MTNSSNDAVRYALAAAKVTDANGALGTLVVTDSSGIEITGPVTLNADQTVTYRVRTNVADVANGSTGTVSLTATAVDSAGNVLAQSTAANGKTTVETVFADTAGRETADAAKDCKHSARATFTVASAQLTVNKTSVVLSDGLSPATAFPNAKAIPGATVQYCIGVSNASGGAAATDLVINDPVATLLAALAGGGTAAAERAITNTASVEWQANGRTESAPNNTVTVVVEATNPAAPALSLWTLSRDGTLVLAVDGTRCGPAGTAARTPFGTRALGAAKLVPLSAQTPGKP